MSSARSGSVVSAAASFRWAIAAGSRRAISERARGCRTTGRWGGAGGSSAPPGGGGGGLLARPGEVGDAAVGGAASSAEPRRLLEHGARRRIASRFAEEQV